jgi:hypothetical protein
VRFLRRHLCLTAAAIFAAAAFAAPAQAGTGQFTLFEAPRELQSHDDALRARTLDELQGLGVKWLRVVVYWRSVAPESGSATAPAFDQAGQDGYHWTVYDRLIGEARARGLKVFVTVSGPVPKWATSTRRDYVTKPSVAGFQKFVTAVGNRYGPQVSMWSIWNEPNHPGFLGPQYAGKGRKRHAYSPGLYRKLFLAGDRALRATGNGATPLLIGETLPRAASRAVSPLRFLRGLTAPRGMLPADGWAHHAYTTSAGPFFRPRGRDDVTIGVLSRLTKALDQAARAKRLKRGMRVYLTEFGIQSYPDPFIGVSYQRQAEYRSISEWIAWRNPRVAAFSQYLMRDDDPRPGSQYARYGGFESGLRRSTGAVKPAYDAFRLPLVADARGRRVHMWGFVRPAAGRTRVEVQLRARGSRTWKRLERVTTNGAGYWRSVTSLRRGASYRVAWGSRRGPATRAY